MHHCGDCGTASGKLGRMVSDPVIRLDTETADYIAAKTVRAALVKAPQHHFILVEQTIRSLFAAGLIDMKTAVHVILYVDRFHIVEAPTMFDAKWHSAADEIPSPTVTSAHPFTAGQ
jgi:hypothetical protein